MDSPRPHILAIHGIRTGLTNPAWPWQFAAYVDKVKIDAHVETEHYKAGPWPRWNKYIVNPPIARALVNRVLLRREILGPSRVHIVAHSNGAVVALSIAKRLAAAGVPVETLVMIAGAIDSDIRKSGLLFLNADGKLGKAVAYSSPDDAVIKHLQSLPGAYGSLGARGFTLGRERSGSFATGYSDGPPFAEFLTRTFVGFGHSDYFSPAWCEATFSSVLFDMDFDLFPVSQPSPLDSSPLDPSS